MKDKYLEYYNDGGKFHQLTDSVVLNVYKKAGNPLKVLELGTGKGELAEQLTKLGATVTCVDFVKVYPQTVECDVEEFLNKDTEKYDAVFIKYTLALLNNKNEVVRKSLERLNPNGCLVVITPLGESKIALREEEMQELVKDTVYEKEQLTFDSVPAWVYFIKG